MDLLVLQAAPLPLDEDVVQPAPAPIHADPHLGTFQPVGKRSAGDLRTLVGIEDLRPPFFSGQSSSASRSSGALYPGEPDPWRRQPHLSRLRAECLKLVSRFV